MIEKENVLRIPQYRMDAFTERVDKFNRRIVKLGLEADDISFTVVGTETERHQIGPNQFVPVTYNIIVFDASNFAIPGWEFIAKLEHHDNGRTMIMDPSGKLPNDARWQNAVSHCDHCHRDIFRKNTYVVRNTDTGEYLQIGSSCVKDFVGHKPERVLRFYQWAAKVWSEGGEIHPRDYIYTQSYLAYVAALTRIDGFMSRTAARDREFTVATADVAMNWYCSDKGFEDYKVTEDDTKFVTDALNWLETEVATKDSLTNYEHNLVAAGLRADYISYSEVGIVASLIPAYGRYIERKLEADRRARANADKSNEWLGSLKERKVFEATVVDNRYMEGDYGSYHLIRFEDAAGNAITWFGSGALASDMVVGESYKFKGTIKRLDEFKGRKQTIVNRVALI